MRLAIRPITPEFAAEVTGLDAAQPLDDADLAELWRAIDRYCVLVLPDQRLVDGELKDFAARFGPLEIGRIAARGGKRRLALPEIGDISNLDLNNRLRARDDRGRLDALGNRLWHTDGSFRRVPLRLHRPEWGQGSCRYAAQCPRPSGLPGRNRLPIRHFHPPRQHAPFVGGGDAAALLYSSWSA